MNRPIALAVAALLLLSCASGSNDDAQKSDTDTNRPRYTAEPGSTPVGVIPAGTLRDPKRNKDLEVSIDYPTRGSAAPVIIFSHGLGSAPRDYSGLAAYWASHGYVVIRPAHADARRSGDMRADDEQLGRQGANDWLNRAQDITLITESLAALETQYPELQGKINREQIGVAGYSFGAFTTMLTAGTRTFMQGGAPVSYRDPRVKAALAMSPQGPSPSRGLTNESWAEVRIPTMFMTGTADIGANETENAAWRSQGFELSPAGEKWLIVLQGAGHLTFSGRSAAPTEQSDPRSSNPPVIVDPRYPASQQQQPQTRSRPSAGFERDRMLFRAIQAITLAFFDTYLKEDTKGREYLNKLSERGDIEVKTK
jgi:predicted dienelactone hydrolase